ncbi:MAG: hypothetical protein ACI9K4_001411, partial [Polaribacter sp.]
PDCSGCLSSFLFFVWNKKSECEKQEIASKPVF